MGACQECRKAKVKCEPCDAADANAKTSIGSAGPQTCKRCKRLKLPCTPHVSRQGKGPKKRKAAQPANDCEAAGGTSVEACVVKESSQLGSNHYGLHFVIRHWVSIAATRRSFSLLDRACSLACRCGIGMDQIMCGDNNFPLAATSLDGNRSMSFLPGIILKPSSEQQVGGSALLLKEVPADMLQAIECNEGSAHPPESRWIIVREMKCGVSRYYVSEAMQKDIASLDRVQQTWQQNLMEVNDLWLPKEEKPKFSRGFNQQLAIYKDPFMEPRPTSIKGTKIRLNDGSETNVDCCLCLKIVNLDQGFISIEYYVPREKLPEAAPSASRADSELFADMSFLDSMMDELEATGELDALMQDFEF